MKNDFLFILLCTLTLTGCDPFRTKFEDTENAAYFHRETILPAPAPVDTLVVVSWNIRFGAGRIPLFYDGRGERYNMTKAEVEANLDHLCAKIVELDPDILLLQEVDVESKRTAYVNELTYILAQTHLNYSVFAAMWKADYVPSDGIGRINFGSAILSKWPLTHAVRIALPTRTDQSALEDYFFLHRNILKASLAIPGHPDLQILNMHAETFGTDGTKKKHLDIFKEEADKITAAGGFFVGGGDFNEIPPGSPLWKNFPDDVQNSRFGNDDYTGQETWMNNIYSSYESAIPLAKFQSNPSLYYSFTGDPQGFWCRTLEYLFTNSKFRAGEILQTNQLPNSRAGISTMPLSDHAPYYSVLEVKP
jgi:endonuclease/exonuclease/phosphatase family metal-dependent hydrolase